MYVHTQKMSLQYPRRKRVCCVWNGLKIKNWPRLGSIIKWLANLKQSRFEILVVWKLNTKMIVNTETGWRYSSIKLNSKGNRFGLYWFYRRWSENEKQMWLHVLLLRINEKAKSVHTWHTLQTVKYPVKSIQMRSTVVFPYFDCVSINCVLTFCHFIIKCMCLPLAHFQPDEQIRKWFMFRNIQQKSVFLLVYVVMVRLMWWHIVICLTFDIIYCAFGIINFYHG